MVEGSRLHVLLRIRELKPSPGRSRARSLGSAVVTMLASSPLLPLELTTLQARKDQALLQTKRSETALKLSEFEDATTYNIKNGEESVVSISPDLLAHACCFFDGGNILLWMAREAERIGSSSTEIEASSCVASMVSFSVCAPSDLETLGLRRVNISSRRTPVSGSASAVQVEIWGSDSSESESATGVRHVFANAVFIITTKRIPD
jgi:hypothetical protein